MQAIKGGEKNGCNSIRWTRQGVKSHGRTMWEGKEETIPAVFFWKSKDTQMKETRVDSRDVSKPFPGHLFQRNEETDRKEKQGGLPSSSNWVSTPDRPGIEHTSRALRKVVQRLIRLLFPPTSFWIRQEHKDYNEKYKTTCIVLSLYTLLLFVSWIVFWRYGTIIISKSYY